MAAVRRDADTLNEAAATVAVAGIRGPRIRCFVGRRGWAKVDELVRGIFIPTDDAFARGLRTSGSLFVFNGRRSDDHDALRMERYGRPLRWVSSRGEHPILDFLVFAAPTHL